MNRDFPPERRLRTQREFQYVFKGGRRCVRPRLVVVARELPEAADYSKVGLAVSKKVAKKAHDRNLIRRRLRELFRTNQPRIAPGWAIVLVGRPEARNAEFDQLRQDFESAMKKLGLLVSNHEL